MPRILGVDVPKEKRIEIALTYIYGVGRKCSNSYPYCLFAEAVTGNNCLELFLQLFKYRF